MTLTVIYPDGYVNRGNVSAWAFTILNLDTDKLSDLGYLLTFTGSAGTSAQYTIDADMFDGNGGTTDDGLLTYPGNYTGGANGNAASFSMDLSGFSDGSIKFELVDRTPDLVLVTSVITMDSEPKILAHGTTTDAQFSFETEGDATLLKFVPDANTSNIFFFNLPIDMAYSFNVSFYAKGSATLTLTDNVLTETGVNYAKIVNASASVSLATDSATPVSNTGANSSQLNRFVLDYNKRNETVTLMVFSGYTSTQLGSTLEIENVSWASGTSGYLFVKDHDTNTTTAENPFLLDHLIINRVLIPTLNVGHLSTYGTVVARFNKYAIVPDDDQLELTMTDANGAGVNGGRYIRFTDGAGNVEEVPVAFTDGSGTATVTTLSGIVEVLPSGMLDSLSVDSSAVGAYALRHLFGSYIGPHIRIRRSSDSAEADIWFDEYGTLKKLTSTTDWLNGATAYVTTWYDQSGQGNHGTQTDTSAQPSLDLANRWLSFDSNDYFNLPDGTVPYGDSPYTVTVYHGSINNTDGGILGSGNYENNNQVLLFRRNSFDYRNDWWGNTLDITQYASNQTVTYTYDQAARRGYANGSFVDSKIGGGRYSTAANNTIGVTHNNTYYLNGELNSILIWNTALGDGDVSNVSFLVKTGPSTFTFNGYNKLNIEDPPAGIQSVTLSFTPTGGTETQEIDAGTATEIIISETGAYSVFVNGLFFSEHVVVGEITSYQISPMYRFDLAYGNDTLLRNDSVSSLRFYTNTNTQINFEQKISGDWCTSMWIFVPYVTGYGNSNSNDIPSDLSGYTHNFGYSWSHVMAWNMANNYQVRLRTQHDAHVSEYNSYDPNNTTFLNDLFLKFKSSIAPDGLAHWSPGNSNQVLMPEAWHHMAWEYKSDTGVFTFYCDGVQQVSTTFSTGLELNGMIFGGPYRSLYTDGGNSSGNPYWIVSDLLITESYDIYHYLLTKGNYLNFLPIPENVGVSQLRGVGNEENFKDAKLTFDGYNRLTIENPLADIQSVTLRFTPTGGTETQEIDAGTVTEFTISETGTYSVIVRGTGSVFISEDVVVTQVLNEGLGSPELIYEGTNKLTIVNVPIDVINIKLSFTPENSNTVNFIELGYNEETIITENGTYSCQIHASTSYIFTNEVVVSSILNANKIEFDSLNAEMKYYPTMIYHPARVARSIQKLWLPKSGFYKIEMQTSGSEYRIWNHWKAYNSSPGYGCKLTADIYLESGYYIVLANFMGSEEYASDTAPGIPGPYSRYRGQVPDWGTLPGGAAALIKAESYDEVTMNNKADKVIIFLGAPGSGGAGGTTEQGQGGRHGGSSAYDSSGSNLQPFGENIDNSSPITFYTDGTGGTGGSGAPGKSPDPSTSFNGSGHNGYSRSNHGHATIVPTTQLSLQQHEPSPFAGKSVNNPYGYQVHSRTPEYGYHLGSGGAGFYGGGHYGSGSHYWNPTLLKYTTQFGTTPTLTRNSALYNDELGRSYVKISEI